MGCFIIIPAYNEQELVGKVINGAKEYSDNIIVVDDGSKYNTYENAKSLGVTVLKHGVNLGKGAALKTGCEYAFQNGADKVIVMDADTQHDPGDIPRFLEALKDCDIVLSYRRYSKAMPFVLKFGNQFINKTIKFLYGLEIRDSQCGYRAFKAGAYKKLKWKAADYSIESETIAKIGRYKLSYKELPIETVYADKYKGTTVLDGIKIVINLLLWKISRI